MRVALGIPVIDSVPGEVIGHHLLISAEIARAGELMVITPLNVHPHDRVRNLIIGDAIEAECDYLFFVDDDMLIPKGAFTQLMADIQEHQAVAVSGHYYRRGYPYTCVWSMLATEEMRKTLNDPTARAFQLSADSGVHKIDYSGFGCCLLDLKWIKDHMAPPWSSMEQDEHGTVVADDVSFFERVRERGGVVLGNADVRCGHLGARHLVCDATANQLRAEHVRLNNKGMDLKKLFDKPASEDRSLRLSEAETEENKNGNDLFAEVGKPSNGSGHEGTGQ